MPEKKCQVDHANIGFFLNIRRFHGLRRLGGINDATEEYGSGGRVQRKLKKATSISASRGNAVYVINALWLALCRYCHFTTRLINRSVDSRSYRLTRSPWSESSCVIEQASWKVQTGHRSTSGAPRMRTKATRMKQHSNGTTAAPSTHPSPSRPQ